MLYPIELTFENAREFRMQTVYFADPKVFQNVNEIRNHYKDNVLIGGLNGTGKSTIATVFICILNADVNEADPVDLISSSQAYTDEKPWIFKGRLIFYNDGSLEDNKMFIEINARFEGITEYEKPKIRSKYFTIKESDSIEGLKKAHEYVYSNKNDKYGKLDDYKKQIEALGISPDKYLLYWKQGETSKFTQIKDVERFIQLSKMMGIEESIDNLDRMIQQQAEKEKEANTLNNNCLQLEIDLRKKELEKDQKVRRDEELMDTSANLIGTLNALIKYNEEMTETLKRKIEVNEQALSKYDEQKAKVEEELYCIVDQKIFIQVELDQCMDKTEKINEQMISASQSVTKLEKAIEEGKSKYRQIKEFLDQLKEEELGIGELEILINKLQSQVITIKQSIQKNESSSIDKQKLLKELEEKILTLETEKIELERQIIRAQQVVEENLSEIILQERIDSISLDIDNKQESFINNSTERLRLQRELTTISKNLYFHSRLVKKEFENIKKEIEQEEALVEQRRSNLQSLSNKKIILENELSKESAEQLDNSILSFKRENEKFEFLGKNYTEVVDQMSSTVIGLYHSIKKISADLFIKIQETDRRLEHVKIQMNMTKKSIDNLYLDQQKIRTALTKHLLSSEEYIQKIKESRYLESQLTIEINKITEQIIEYNDQLTKIDDGIIDYSQQKSIEKQSFETYAFKDIFEFKDTQLNQDKEMHLTLLKYTILVKADEKDIFPYSNHYHVALNEYEPDDSDDPLPFGLSLKDNINTTDAKKAISWLRQINGYLGDRGLIKDSIGIRGYDPDDVNYCLSTAARQYTKTILCDKIKEAEAKVRELNINFFTQQEITTTLETEKNQFDNLLSRLSELKELVVQLEKNLEEYIKNEDTIKGEVAKYCKFQKTMDSVKSTFKETYDNQHSIMTFDLNEIVLREIEFKEQIVLFENNKELLAETIAKIQSNNTEVSKLQSKLSVHKEVEENLQKVNSDIEVKSGLFNQEVNKLTSLQKEHEIKKTSFEKIEQWKYEFDKYFSKYAFYLDIERSSEQINDQLTLERTQEIGENLYLYYENLNNISLDIDKIAREIESLKNEKSQYADILVKVIKAQEVTERIPHKIQLIESITRYRTQLENYKIDIRILEQKLNELKENQQIAQSRLNQYQSYFQKHQELDFNFMNHYELELKRLDIEREQHRKLLENFHNLTMIREVHRKQLEEIQLKIIPIDENLKQINISIETLKVENNTLINQLRKLEEHINPTIQDEYGYRSLIEDSFSQIALGDILPIFRITYNSKFSEAVQDGYMLSFDEFVKSLYIKIPEIIEEDEYALFSLSIRQILKEIRTLTTRTIKESAVNDYEILKLEFQKNMNDKQRLEEELASFRVIVESDYITVEGIITSSIRSVAEKLNEVIAPMNYIVQLEYRNKDEGAGRRRLVMWFKKSHEQQMRLVTERGGLSGGEHAIVSLMLMYSILSVKEEKKMEGKSGGYLLLDEWDANLDPLKVQNVFQVLKKLGKKIISITPRSSSRNYISEFGLLLRVINTPSRHGIVVLKERNEETLDEFFNEFKVQEKNVDEVGG